MGVAGSNRRGPKGARPAAGGKRTGAKPRAIGVASGRAHRNGKATGNGKATAKPRVMRFTIASNYESGHDVQQRIMGDVLKRGFSEDTTFAIRIALEEALVNAIKHGNRLDPRKKVRVEAKVGPKRAEFVIEDEGPGFARSCVPDPTADENLCKCNGRGILLIEAYMNSVKWDRGGRRVRMVKNNGPE